MKTSRLHGPRDMRLEDVPEPIINQDEVLIRVHTMGVCGSDLHRYTGDFPANYPLILGHEFAGDIVQLGANAGDLRVGQRVTAEPNFWCGKCVYCQAGKQNLCVHRIGLAYHIDGCQAEYVKVPAPFVWPLPDNMTYAQGAMVEPLMAALHSFRRSRAKLGDTIAILGCGTIGLLALLCAKAAGCRVVAVDVIPAKLELAKKLGADEIINGREADPVETVKRMTDGLGLEIAMETAGFPATVEQAVGMVSQGGRVVLVGLSNRPAQITPATVVRREIEICGSYLYHAREFASGIQLIASGAVDVLALAGFTADLDHAQEAYDQALAGKVAKALIKI
jgi:L-iditol 2-dehydrogenase